MPKSDSRWGRLYNGLVRHIQSERFKKFTLCGFPSQLAFWSVFVGLIEYANVYHVTASWVAFGAYVVTNTYTVRIFAYQHRIFWCWSTVRYAGTHLINQIWGSGVLYIGVDVFGIGYVWVQGLLVFLYFVVNAGVAEKEFG